MPTTKQVREDAVRAMRGQQQGIMKCALDEARRVLVEANLIVAEIQHSIAMLQTLEDPEFEQAFSEYCEAQAIFYNADLDLSKPENEAVWGRYMSSQETLASVCDKLGVKEPTLLELKDAAKRLADPELTAVLDAVFGR